MCCDKPTENKSEKRHIYSRYHQSLTKSINSRYYVTNPNFLHIEDILLKYVDFYNKKFESN